jgi:hypothetical protein
MQSTEEDGGARGGGTKARGRAHSERARVARWCVSALSPVVVSVPEYLLASGQTVPENNAAYGVSCPRLLRGVWQRRALFSAKAGLSPPQPAQIARMIPHRGQRDRLPRRWCCPPPPASLTIHSQTRVAKCRHCLVAARVSMACASLSFPLEPHARCYPDMISPSRPRTCVSQGTCQSLSNTTESHPQPARRSPDSTGTPAHPTSAWWTAHSTLRALHIFLRLHVTLETHPALCWRANIKLAGHPTATSSSPLF